MSVPLPAAVIEAAVCDECTLDCACEDCPWQEWEDWWATRHAKGKCIVFPAQAGDRWAWMNTESVGAWGYA